jgi:hypothetical protein
MNENSETSDQIKTVNQLNEKTINQIAKTRKETK